MLQILSNPDMPPNTCTQFTHSAYFPMYTTASSTHYQSSSQTTATTTYHRLAHNYHPPKNNFAPNTTMTALQCYTPTNLHHLMIPTPLLSIGRSNTTYNHWTPGQPSTVPYKTQPNQHQHWWNAIPSIFSVSMAYPEPPLSMSGSFVELWHC